MDTIATCAATDGYNPITGVNFFVGFIAWQNADIPAIDKWITEVPSIEIHGAIDGWDAHTIAIIADTCNHALHDAARMQTTWRQCSGIGIRWSKTKDVCVADRFGPKTCAKRIADHTTDTCVGTSIRFDRRGMVVGFHFEDHVIFVIEANDTRVVFEYFDAPIFGAEFFSNRFRGGEDRFTQHVLEMLCAVFIAVFDFTR